MFRKSDLRMFFPASEYIIFAEHNNADSVAKGESGYGAKCDELRGFVFEPLRAYLAKEQNRAGLSTQDVAEAWRIHTGNTNRTGMAGHWFEKVQWVLPTQENYAWLRALFNRNGKTDFLRREYEDLRREYEDLRREYEDLRRPFSVTPKDQYTDVWTFPTVQVHKGKHPCEKPLDLISHIVRVSSRPNALVLDTFTGSGVVGEACRIYGRKFIGVDSSEHWCRRTVERLQQQCLPLGVT